MSALGALSFFIVTRRAFWVSRAACSSGVPVSYCSTIVFVVFVLKYRGKVIAFLDFSV